MRCQKLIAADAELAAKFNGSFTCDGGNGEAMCYLYRNGKAKIEVELTLETETVNFSGDGKWHMNEQKELIIELKNEKDNLETYVSKTGSSQQEAGNNLSLIIALSVSIPVFVIGVGLVVFFIIRRKKKNK